MPQLDPEPWLAMIIYSWSVYLIVLLPKVLNFTFANNVVTTEIEKLEPQTWNWSWHQTYSTNS